MPIDTDLGGASSARLGHDLPSVACQAAIELDNLILGRGTSLPGIAELSNRLTEEVPNVPDLNSPLSLVDPSTVVALHGTLQEASITGPSDDIADLTRRAGEIVQRLKTVSDNPQAARSGDLAGLRKLKEFCLILSRRAAAASGDPDEARPPHPYRRQG
jgi:hypothetical protein